MGTVVASPSHAFRRGGWGGRKLDAPTGTSRARLCFGCFNWLMLGLFRHWRSPFSLLQQASVALRAISRRRAGVILTIRGFVAFRRQCDCAFSRAQRVGPSYIFFLVGLGFGTDAAALAFSARYFSHLALTARRILAFRSSGDILLAVVCPPVRPSAMSAARTSGDNRTFGTCPFGARFFAMASF